MSTIQFLRPELSFNFDSFNSFPISLNPLCELNSGGKYHSYIWYYFIILLIIIIRDSRRARTYAVYF